MTKAPSPLKTYLIAWGCVIATIVTGIIVYQDVELVSIPSLYLLLSIAIFSTSYLFAKRYKLTIGKKQTTRRVKHITWRTETRRYRRLITLLSLCGIVAAGMFAAEMIFVTGLSTLDFKDVRQVFTNRNVTILSQLASILGAGGFFSLIAAIVCWDYIPFRTRLLWLLSPLSMVVFSVLSGGRQMVLQLLLFLFFSLLLRFKIFSISKLKAIMIGSIFTGIFAAILAYGMIVSFERNARISEISKKQLVLKLFQAHLNPTVDKLTDSLPNIARDGTTELIIYFTHPIPNFLYFWDINTRLGPYYGFLELPFLARRLNNLGVLEDSVESRSDYIDTFYVDSGKFTQVWQTQLRDLIMDFTPAGALVVWAAFGFITGRVVKNYEQRSGLALAIVVVGLNLICFYSILLPAIADTFIFFFFIIGFSLLLKDRMLKYDYIVVDHP